VRAACVIVRSLWIPKGAFISLLSVVSAVGVGERLVPVPPIWSSLFFPASTDAVGKLDGLLVFVLEVLGEVVIAASALDIRLIHSGGNIPDCYNCQEKFRVLC
jgi:hypothetical protein